MKRFVFLLLVLIALTVLGTLLFRRAPQQRVSADIATTIYPLYDITRNIAGETLTVAPILPPGASPHTFEPTPSLLRSITDAAVVYAIGLEFDTWADPLITTIGADTVLVSDGITIRPSAAHEEEGDNEEEDEHGEFDPHYWLTVPNATIIARNIAADLSKRFPEHADAIALNLERYTNELAALDVEIRAELATTPNKNLITLHDGWYYLADEYGLTILGTFEPTAGREPTPQYLVELTQGVKQAGTHTIYSEPQLGTAGLNTFATDNGLKILEIDPIGGTPGRETYIQLMRSNARQISQNQ